MERAEDAFGAAGTNLPLHWPLWPGLTFVLGTRSEEQRDERGWMQPLQLRALHYTPPPALGEAVVF